MVATLGITVPLNHANAYHDRIFVLTTWVRSPQPSSACLILAVSTNRRRVATSQHQNARYVPVRSEICLRGLPLVYDCLTFGLSKEELCSWLSLGLFTVCSATVADQIILLVHPQAKTSKAQQPRCEFIAASTNANTDDNRPKPGHTSA